jgi:hypothetical protein
MSQIIADNKQQDAKTSMMAIFIAQARITDESPSGYFDLLRRLIAITPTNTSVLLIALYFMYNTMKGIRTI